MQNRRREMSAHVPVRSERLTLDRSAGEDWARIDPTVFIAEGRRLQARAMVEALATGWHGLRWGVDGLAVVVRRLRARLARRSARNRAVKLLSRLDDRLLADIGLRRADIGLAVDGRLADPRVRRQTARAELLLEGTRRPLPAAAANSNQPVAPRPVPGLAA
jgi:uncharacterized protein YjiS (DUF1127 family)